MEPLELHAHAAAYFGGILAGVAPDDAARPTPCSELDVRALVSHVIGGERMAVALLGGASAEAARAAITSSVELDGVLATFEEAVAAAHAAFSIPGALDQVVHHPIGDVTAAQLLGFRIADLTLHGWDLARATGADETIDPALVDAVYAQLAPLGAVIADLGVFGEGPSGAVGDDAPLQARLLDLTGRRP